MQSRGKLLLRILAGFLVALVFTFFMGTTFEERLEYNLQDALYRLRGPVPPPEEIVLVAMDELSYRDLSLPMHQAWPRSLHAALLARLKEYGVKRVVFDVLFLDPWPAPDVDTSLAEAFSSLPVVIGAEAAERELRTVAGSFTVQELLLPPPMFQQAVESVALVGLPEEYGVIRRFLVPPREAGSGLRPLAEAAIGERLAETPRARDFLRYYGPPGTIPTFSYYQVLQQEKPLPQEYLAGKTVFVGLAMRTESGPAQKDSFLTPFRGQRMFGVEVHATAAANLLEGEWIRGQSQQTKRIASLLAAIVGGALLVSFSPLGGLVTLVVLLSSWAIVSWLAFLQGIVLPGALVFIVLLPGLYVLSSLAYYLIVRRQQKKVQRAFELYVAPTMARQIAKNTKLLAPGGNQVVATALFTDIADFTSITEKMDSSEVAAMLNTYFTEVMDVIFQNEGTLIKFIGDAVFVIWGAPISLPDHGARALRTACEIDLGVQRFNNSGRFPRLDTRIGIHTGPMLVGNLGSVKRFDYTAIGDSVNLASRVEGLNKFFGTTILFTGAVKAAASTGDTQDSICVGSVAVKGKEDVVSLYTPLTSAFDVAEVTIWNEARENFVAQNWEAAAKLFESLYAEDAPFQTMAGLYLQQIDLLRMETPTNWQGELRFSVK